MIWGSMVPPLSQKVAIFYQFWSRFVLKSWLFLNFLANFYELALLTKCWLFQTRNPPLSLFLAFWLLYFHNFVQKLFEMWLFN